MRVEAGAGLAALAADEDYGAAGADVRSGDVLEGADLVAHVRPLLPAQVARLRPGAVTVGFVTGPGELDGIRALQAAGVTALAMELIPRISRAQSMDALTSQALVAGYRCALEAAMRLPRFFPLFMTAAGTVPPAKVLVLGAGVAGLQAIATARGSARSSRPTTCAPPRPTRCSRWGPGSSTSASTRSRAPAATRGSCREDRAERQRRRWRRTSPGPTS